MARKERWTGVQPTSANTVSAGSLAMIVDLLPTIDSLRDLASITGLSLKSVRREAAPFLAIMKLRGDHPQCGCGREKFHSNGCIVSSAKGRNAGHLPGHTRKTSALLLERRQAAIGMLTAGFRLVDIDVMLGMHKGAAKAYRRFLSEEQIAQRRACAKAHSTLSPDQSAARYALYKVGLSDGQIGAALGLAQSTVHAWRKAEGLAPLRRPGGAGLPHCNPEVEARRRELYGEGLSDSQIARELQIDRSTVSTWRRQRGFPPNLPKCSRRPLASEVAA